MRLLLIRHGQTEHNLTRSLDTAAPGGRLTALGEAQASAVPDALADVDVTAIYSSDRLRTRQTAAPLAASRSLDVGVLAGLEEIDAGDLEMRSDPDSIARYVAPVAAWIGGDLDPAIPGGPDGHAFARRFRRAVDQILADHEPEATVAVFSHGAAIRVFTALTAGLDRETAQRISNTGMADLSHVARDTWVLNRWVAEPLGGADLAAEPTGTW